MKTKTKRQQTEALRLMATALDAIDAAQAATSDGVADDHCGNALREMRKALYIQAHLVTEPDKGE